MTSNEQEALSHQHSHGLWLVPLSDGSFAIFDHPRGRLRDIVRTENDQEGNALYMLKYWADLFCKDRQVVDHVSRTIAADLDLSNINL